MAEQTSDFQISFGSGFLFPPKTPKENSPAFFGEAVLSEDLAQALGEKGFEPSIFISAWYKDGAKGEFLSLALESREAFDARLARNKGGGGGGTSAPATRQGGGQAQRGSNTARQAASTVQRGAPRRGGMRG
jgi:hypothetical protein